MLNLISDFLNEEEDLQFINEHQAAIKIRKLLQSNLLFFKHSHIDIYQKIICYQASRYSVFCTKDEQLNIVETVSGRVLYGEKPVTEILTEVTSFCQAAPFVSLDPAITPSSPKQVPHGSVILLFGIGAGLHIKPLLQQAAPNILVIYEADFDLFVTSLQIIDWSAVFDLAAEVNTQISLQLDNSGVSIAADLRELVELLPMLDSIFLYRHLAHPVSDEVFNYLLECSGQRDKLLNHSRQFVGYIDNELFLAERAAGVLANQLHVDAPKNTLFKKNIEALKRYYPVIYHAFVNYQPKNWRAVKVEGQVNLWCQTRPGLFYKDLKNQSAMMVERYLKSPLDNQVILNQGGIQKLRNYVHYQAIEKLQEVLTTLQPRVFDEHADVDNLIVLGVGLGRHIELLLQQRNVKNLFIFEPNIDFFYASLYVTNWAKLFKHAAESEQRFYFNIGGTGDEYFHDIMGQYYQTGAYGIAKTQIFPAFLTASMRLSLDKLQSQLKIIVAMGECFDHVRFGIAHTFQSLCQGHHFLKQQRDEIDIKPLQDIPVFIVGNGPSLDDSYAYIKEHREQVIVVSCGTALRSLYSLGITPDFHAEIEQNQATYGWISQVGDFEWLKRIPLLSINGIHPKTAALFKTVYLAFKDGESSTNFLRSILQQKNIKISSLSHAYPTVSNLALDFFTELGCKQLYLMGVDLGYVSAEHHHSKHSAYYHKDGSGLFDANKHFNVGILIKGNFRPQVQTKHEFDFSRSIMEITIAKATKNTAFYNCSDGAYINGAVPLRPENILITPSAVSASVILEQYFGRCFYTDELSEFKETFSGMLRQNEFANVVSGLLNISQDVQSYTEAKQLIDLQWQYFIKTYDIDNKLSFYLLCGSIIYMLSVLTRVLPISTKTEEFDIELQTFNRVLQIWREYLEHASISYTESPFKNCDVDISYLFKK